MLNIENTYVVPCQHKLFNHLRNIFGCILLKVVHVPLYPANGSAPNNQLLLGVTNVGVVLVEAGDSSSSSKHSTLY